LWRVKAAAVVMLPLPLSAARQWRLRRAIDANQRRCGDRDRKHGAHEFGIVRNVRYLQAFALECIEAENVAMDSVRRPWPTVAATIAGNIERHEIARELRRAERQL